MSRLPCGNCDIGTYAVQATRNGLDRLGSCPDQKSALLECPCCHCDPRKICAGAVDFVRTIKFPISAEIKAQILEDISR